MTDRDDARVAKALQGMTFPADRDALLEYAHTRDVDPKSMQALRALPERSYGTMNEVIDAVPQEPEGSQRPGGTDRQSPSGRQS